MHKKLLLNGCPCQDVILVGSIFLISVSSTRRGNGNGNSRDNGNDDNISLNSITLRVSSSSVWQGLCQDRSRSKSSRSRSAATQLLLLLLFLGTLAFKIPHLMCLELLSLRLTLSGRLAARQTIFVGFTYKVDLIYCLTLPCPSPCAMRCRGP